jgi:hypothetical protein
VHRNDGAARRVSDDRAVYILLWLTRSPHPWLRRAGVYGLAPVTDRAHVRMVLRERERNDADSDVRLAASIVLSGF